MKLQVNQRHLRSTDHLLSHRTEAAVARKPSPVRQNSYVLSAIRKFE